MSNNRYKAQRFFYAFIHILSLAPLEPIGRWRGEWQKKNNKNVDWKMKCDTKSFYCCNEPAGIMYPTDGKKWTEWKRHNRINESKVYACEKHLSLNYAKFLSKYMRQRKWHAILFFLFHFPSFFHRRQFWMGLQNYSFLLRRVQVCVCVYIWFIHIWHLFG